MMTDQELNEAEETERIWRIICRIPLEYDDALDDQPYDNKKIGRIVEELNKKYRHTGSN